jgi:hypothetical protein
LPDAAAAADAWLAAKTGPSDITGKIGVMWIASDPKDRRRRTAFGSEQAARGFAEQMDPAWTVKPAQDPLLPVMTGRRVDEDPSG